MKKTKEVEKGSLEKVNLSPLSKDERLSPSEFKFYKEAESMGFEELCSKLLKPCMYKRN